MVFYIKGCYFNSYTVSKPEFSLLELASKVSYPLELLYLVFN